jgi:predicted ATP-dependent serine protease
MVLSAARRKVPCLVVASEEGGSNALVARFQRAGADDLTAKLIRIADCTTMQELEDDLAAMPEARIVVLDSVDALRATPEAVGSAMLGRSWISVHHVNAQGGAYGGHAWSHCVDVCIATAKGIATPTKNRGGPMHALPIFDQ